MKSLQQLTLHLKQCFIVNKAEQWKHEEIYRVLGGVSPKNIFYIMLNKYGFLHNYRRNDKHLNTIKQCSHTLAYYYVVYYTTAETPMI